MLIVHGTYHVLLAIVLGILTFLFWLTPIRNLNDSTEVVAIWGFRAGMTIGFGAAVRWIAVGSDDTTRRERLALMQPSLGARVKNARVVGA